MHKHKLPWEGPGQSSVELHMRRTYLQFGRPNVVQLQPLGQTNKIQSNENKSLGQWDFSRIYSLSSIHEKIDVYPTVALHTFCPSESDG